jgi:hypothetical protein
MHFFLRNSFCLSLSCLLLTACSLGDRFDQLSLPPYQPAVAVPLIQVSLSTQALLAELRPGDSLLSTGPDGLITLRYADSVYSVGAGNYLRLDDLQVPITQQQGTLPLELLGNQALAAATLATGHLAYEIELPQPGNYELTLLLPDAQLEGKTFAHTQPLSGGRYQETGLPLTGYQFSFPDGDLRYAYQLTDLSTGQPVSPSHFTLSFKDLTFAYIEGPLGDFLLREDLKGTPFDALEGFQADVFELGAPRLSFIAHNSFGLPVAFRIGHFRAYNRLGEQVDMVHEPLSQGVVANYPGLDAVGESRQTTVSLTRENANLDDFTRLFPHLIELGWEVWLQPQSNQETYFVTNQSRIDFVLEAELPLAFRARNLRYEGRHEGTFEWPEVPGVSEMTLKLTTENSLPLTAGLGLYFEDSQGQCLDSLVREAAPLFQAAPTHASGEASGTRITTHYFPLDAARYERLQQCTAVRYRLRLDAETAQGQAIQLKSTDSLAFHLGVIAGLELGE